MIVSLYNYCQMSKNLNIQTTNTNNSKYHTRSHSKFLLKAHIVLATKYRKKLLKGVIEEDMKQQIFEISIGQKWSIDIMETDIDHIHILIDYEPVISIFQIVHRIKQLSTYRIWRIHEELLKQFYWKEKTFWSDGYFACSTGNASTETIMEYIRTQG
jgi:putative transposase